MHLKVGYRMRFTSILGIAIVSLAVDCNNLNVCDKKVICPAVDYDYTTVTDFMNGDELIYANQKGYNMVFRVEWAYNSVGGYEIQCNGTSGDCDCPPCTSFNTMSAYSFEEASKNHNVRDGNSIVHNSSTIDLELTQEYPRTTTIINLEIDFFRFKGFIRLQPFIETDHVTWLGDYQLGDSTFKDVVKIDVDTSQISPEFNNDPRYKPLTSTIYFSKYGGIIGFYDLVYNDLFFRKS